MELSEVLEQLHCDEYTFPREALEAAVQQRDAIVPELLKIVERTADHPEDLEDDRNYSAYMFAMYLLAQFREKRAYGPIVRFFSKPNEDELDLTGDFVTEGLHEVLASVSCGDDSLIRELIADPDAYVFARDAALRSLVSLVACGDRTREEVTEYFASLFREKFPREPDTIWDCLVLCSLDLSPEELCLDIEQAFRDDLIDEFFVSREDVRKALAVPKEQAFIRLKEDKRYQIVTDAIGEMASWECFQDEPDRRDYLKPEDNYVPELSAPQLTDSFSETGLSDYYHPDPIIPFVRTQPKVGRNQPCLCGSGKKYKKCCGKT